MILAQRPRRVKRELPAPATILGVHWPQVSGGGAALGVDAAMGSIAVPLYNAAQQGLDVRIIAPVAYVTRTAVLVRKDLWDSGEVRTVADLRGRRIYSVAPGSGANYSRLKWQENAGLRSE